jgi:hypothetical protein
MGVHRRTMMVAVLVVVVLWGCAAARADVESPEVVAGVAAYERLEYESAIELLNQALGQSLTREEYLVAHKTLAFCHVAVGKDELGISDFANVLNIDPAFELDRASSPRERAAFEEAKKRVATGEAETASHLRALSALRPQIVPPQPHAHEAVRMRVEYPGGVANRVSLFYRPRGFGLYEQNQARDDGSGRFELAVPDARVLPPGLEYYLVALDASGASVARAGSLSRPLFLRIAEIQRPLYKRAWFWGLIGGVALVGSAVATAVVLTRTPSNAPAAVTIMIF